MRHFFAQFQNTPIGGYSGTYTDQGSFLHLHNCTYAEESALSADIGLVMNRHPIIRFQRLVRSFLTYGLTTKAGQEPPERTGVNFNSAVRVSMV